MTDQETINTIQNLKIDVLIDLAGLWSANKIEIFNTRICPLQISWLGFNHSTGLKEVDYILADKNTVKNDGKIDIIDSELSKFVDEKGR